MELLLAAVDHLATLTPPAYESETFCTENFLTVQMKAYYLPAVKCQELKSSEHPVRGQLS